MIKRWSGRWDQDSAYVQAACFTGQHSELELVEWGKSDDTSCARSSTPPGPSAIASSTVIQT